MWLTGHREVLIVRRVEHDSGHYTFRAWRRDAPSPIKDADIERDLAWMDVLFEWSSENLIAIDAPSAEKAQLIADYLQSRQEAGQLIFEADRTRHPAARDQRSPP